MGAAYVTGKARQLDQYIDAMEPLMTTRTTDEKRRDGERTGENERLDHFG